MATRTSANRKRDLHFIQAIASSSVVLCGDFDFCVGRGVSLDGKRCQHERHNPPHPSQKRSAGMDVSTELVSDDVLSEFAGVSIPDSCCPTRVRPDWAKPSTAKIDV